MIGGLRRGGGNWADEPGGGGRVVQLGDRGRREEKEADKEIK